MQSHLFTFGERPSARSLPMDRVLPQVKPITVFGCSFFPPFQHIIWTALAWRVGHVIVQKANTCNCKSRMYIFVDRPSLRSLPMKQVFLREGNSPWWNQCILM